MSLGEGAHEGKSVEDPGKSECSPDTSLTGCNRLNERLLAEHLLVRAGHVVGVSNSWLWSVSFLGTEDAHRGVLALSFALHSAPTDCQPLGEAVGVCLSRDKSGWPQPSE